MTRAAIDRHASGAAWEHAARMHLQRAGLQFLAANVRYRFGELDLVMRDADTTVFVEVRYRQHAQFGGGVLSVDAGKRRKLVRAAQAFLAQHPRLASQPCRFDVVAIDGQSQPPQLNWIRAAFTLDDLQ